jgi:endonuclease YncB( thermonuclease family)
MIARVLAFLGASLLFVAAAAAANQPVCGATVAEGAFVAAVEDGGTFDLDDGRRVRLVAVQAPHLARGDAAGWPLAQEAKRRLSTLVVGKEVGLAYAERGIDRHGDVLAHVYLGDGSWLQGLLVAEGLVRVQTRADMRACAAALLIAEEDARQAKRGIWKERYYRVRAPDELGGDIGTFQVAEAKVFAVAAVRKRVYVNFGPDYRTDFTLTVSPRDRKRLAKEGVDPAAWAGKTIRVRGWISLLNGPEIELTHPEQVQVLD